MSPAEHSITDAGHSQRHDSPLKLVRIFEEARVLPRRFHLAISNAAQGKASDLPTKTCERSQSFPISAVIFPLRPHLGCCHET